MTTDARNRLPRIHRTLLGATLAALLIAVVLGWLRPGAIAPAYRLAVFICLAPAIGSLLFALVHRCTGGRWGDVLQPFLIAGSQLAPWIWLLVLPLFVLPPHPFANWPAYGSRAMLALRAGGYALVLFGIALLLARSKPGAAPWIGPVGLIVLVFTLHFLADDWLAALDPGWNSTAFPLVWMLGLSVAGLGCAVLAALLCGLSPRAAGDTPRALGLDWGNLLLTAALLWGYVTFAQFLIIWGGNLPGEISWFTRSARGNWTVIPVLLPVLHFLVPLAILLSRRFKQSPAALGVAAAILLAAQALFVTWVLLPVFDSAGGLGQLLAFTAAIGAAAIFFRQYLAMAGRRLRHP